MENLDKNLVLNRFRRSVDTYNQAAEVQPNMAEALMKQLLLHNPSSCFNRILEFGCGSGMLTDLIEAQLEYQHLYLLDLVEEWKPFHLHRPKIEFMVGDIEQITLPHDLDLILANAVVQWVNNLPALLDKLNHSLLPGGLLGLTTFGPENLREIVALTGRGLSYLNLDELKALVQPQFDVISINQQLFQLQFNSPLAVLRHLRATGTTASVAPERWTRKNLARFSTDYSIFQLGNGKFTLTYHPIILIARKRN